MTSQCRGLDPSPWVEALFYFALARPGDIDSSPPLAPLLVHGRYCQWWQRCQKTARCKALLAPAHVWKR